MKPMTGQPKSHVFGEQKMLKINDIKTAKYNPAKRTATSAVRSLASEIEELGLLYPVLVTSNNELIDGHRRIAACRLLGWHSIPARIVNATQDRAYASVNSTAKKLTGNDLLGIWLQNPGALMPSQETQIRNAVAIIGKPLIREIYEKGLSMRVFRTATRISSYCDKSQNKEFVKQCTKWLVRTAIVGHVMKAVDTGLVKKSALIDAIKANRPLKVSFE